MYVFLGKKFIRIRVTPSLPLKNSRTQSLLRSEKKMNSKDNNLEKKLPKTKGLIPSEIEEKAFSKEDSTEKYTLKKCFNTKEMAYEETDSTSFSKPEQRYTVLKGLGEGGMGVVQLVQDNLLGREVALKKIHIKNRTLQNKEKHLLWRLQREAEITAILEHPNIVPLYDLQKKEDGDLYFTMRKVEGQTFNHLLKKQKANLLAEQNKSLSILLKVCDAISYAHSRGVIHRDLKPDNIMVGAFGEVYVMDWGIAKRLGESEVSEFSHNRSVSPPLEEEAQKTKIVWQENPDPSNLPELFRTMGGIGTMGYMPPEQHENASHVSAQSDIYALGIILKECFTALSPHEEFKLRLQIFQGRDLQKQKVSFKELDQLEKKIPADILAIIKKATAKNVKDRYENVALFALDIENYLKDIPVSAQEYRVDELLRKWAKRHRKPLFFLGGVFFLWTLFWGYWQWQNEQNYTKAKNEAKEKIKQVLPEKLSQGKEEREYLIKLFLQSLTSINKALSYKSGKQESEAFKVEVIEKLLPLCYEEEDYQLASFLVEDLQTLVHFSNKKQELSLQVKENKGRQITEHLKTLKIWENKYKTTDIKTEFLEGEREDFIFDISKMKEEEILEQLFVCLEEGTEIFITEKKVSLIQKFFYQDIVKILGRLGNKKASEKLRNSLQNLYENLILLEINAEEKHIETIRTGKIPEIIEQELQKRLTPQNEDSKNQYHFRKYTENRWEYVTQKNEVFFTVDFSQAKQQLSVYHTRKKNSAEYLPFMNELMKSLCYLEDPISLELIFQIKHHPEFSPLFSSQMDYLLKKFFKNLDFSYVQSPAEYFRKGLIKNHLGNLDEAIASYTKAIQIDPRYIDAYNSRGIAKFNKNEMKEAIEDFTIALQLNPYLAEVYNNRGNARSEMNEIDEAISDYTKAIQINPYHAESYCNRGLVKLENQDIKEAIEDFTQALYINPYYVEAYIYLGEAKLKNQEMEGSILAYNEAIRLAPKFANAYFQRGTAKEANKDFEGAIQDYTEAIRLHPQLIDAYVNRGRAKTIQRDFEGAIDDFTEVIRIEPQSAEAYNNRGLAKFDKADLKGAIEDFSEAIRLKPNNANAYNNRANAYYVQKDLEMALLDANKAIEIDPNMAEIYNSRGNIKRKKYDFEGAIHDYNEAIRLFPEYSLNYANRGLAKFHQQDIEGAILDYTEAIHLNPEDAESYNNRGFAKSKKGDLEGAISDYNEAIRLQPQFALVYNNRGNAKKDKKDFEGALSDYTEAIYFNPQFASAYYNRGLVKETKRDLQGAIEDYELGLAFQENEVVQNQLKNLFMQQFREEFKKKEWIKAKTTLLKFKKYLSPEDPQIKQMDRKIQQIDEFILLKEKE